MASATSATSSESIYAWIAPAPVLPERPPLYHSRAGPQQPLAGSTLRKGTHVKGWGTLGAELKHTVRPDSFLRAHEHTGRVEEAPPGAWTRLEHARRRHPTTAR